MARSGWRGARALPPLAALPLLLGLPGPGAADEAAAVAFPRADVHFEQNATDGDVEVVFEVTGGADGLDRLSVLAPDGRSVVDFRSPAAAPLGIRGFHLESPEPEDVQGLKAAFPEGVYHFAGASAGGERFLGEAILSHVLPAAVSFVHPAPGAEDVAVDGLVIRWTPVENAVGYVLGIEQEALGVELKATLPASARSFPVPDGFLQAGTEYDLGIGSLTADRNVSFVETTFTTSGSD